MRRAYVQGTHRARVGTLSTVQSTTLRPTSPRNTTCRARISFFEITAQRAAALGLHGGGISTLTPDIEHDGKEHGQTVSRVPLLTVMSRAASSPAVNRLLRKHSPPLPLQQNVHDEPPGHSV